MAVWGEIQHKGDITDIRQVMNYVYQLEEQIRYALGHIGNENMTAGCVGVEQLTPGIKQNITNIEINMEETQNRIRETGSILNNRLTDAEGNVSSLTQTVAGLTTRVGDAEGNISSLQQTATSLTTRVGDAEGNISVLQQTATSLTTRVGDAEGNISSLQQTASSLTTRVGDAEGNISVLQQTATGLTSRVGTAEGNISSLQQTSSSISAYVAGLQTNGIDQVSNTAVTINTGGVEINSTGTLKVNMTNFKITSSGDVTVTGEINATTGKIGGFNVGAGYIGNDTDGVYMAKNIYSGNALGSVGGLRVRYYNDSAFAFKADTDGTVLVNGDLKVKKLYLYDTSRNEYRDVTAAVLALV